MEDEAEDLAPEREECTKEEEAVLPRDETDQALDWIKLTVKPLSKEASIPLLSSQVTQSKTLQTLPTASVKELLLTAESLSYYEEPNASRQ